jgi:membrane dipeptidase
VAAELKEAADIDQPGKFQLIRGRPGVVVGVPHATPDTGTMEVGSSSSALALAASLSSASGTPRRASGSTCAWSPLPIGIWHLLPGIERYVQGIKEMVDVIGVHHVGVGSD